MAQEKKQISAQERAMYFAQATRKTYQTLGTHKTTNENETISFTLPKARLLSKVILQVTATVKAKASTGTTVVKRPFAPYGIIRRVTLDLNNGFSPFILSGQDTALYALNRENPSIVLPGDDSRGMAYIENKASVSGSDNKVKFDIHLATTLNDRDAVGLILLQNEESSVTVTIDVGRASDLYALTDNQEATLVSLEVTPVLETFTIPPHEIARPDLSVLKIVQGKSEVFTGGGQNIIKLQTGTIYRKLALYFVDDDGNPLDDADFQGNLEFVFNTADIPISIKPSVLASINHTELGYPLPKGVYLFDWSYQGIPNLGGTRDYIDTERLTEFWLRFSTQASGKVFIVPETISRLV